MVKFELPVFEQSPSFVSDDPDDLSDHSQDCFCTFVVLKTNIPVCNSLRASLRVCRGIGVIEIIFPKIKVK